MFQESYNTVWVHEYFGHKSIRVIDAKKIISVVGMVPYESYEDLEQANRFFLVEKTGLDMGTVAGIEEPLEEDAL